MTNKTCDDCGVKLQGACYVDGSSLLCGDCAENLDYEREMDEAMDYEETDADIYLDAVDLYRNEY